MKCPRSAPAFAVRIFILALVLRLVPVIALRQMGIGLDDMFQYDMLARSMVSGSGYRWYAEADLPLITPWVQLDLNSVEYDPRGVLTSFRPPLYPVFLAVIYLFSGVTPARFFIARLVQAFLAAGLVPLTYLLARRIFPGRERAARGAGWILVFYPMLVIYPLSLATENLFFILVVLSLLVLLKAAGSLEAPLSAGDPPRRSSFMHRSRWFFLAGILLGMLALTRSVALAFIGLACLWVWFILRQKGMAVVVALGVLVLILPWVVRNSLQNHRLTGIESSLGYDLYVGYHPLGTGTFLFPQSLDLMTMLDDGERDEVGIARALEFMQADPWRIPYLVVRRAGYFFGLERRALTYFYSNNYFGHLPVGLLLGIGALVLIPFLVICSSAALGLAVIPWNQETLLLLGFLGGYITPHLFIIAEDRFHLALLPVMAILAGFLWMEGRTAILSRWKTRAGRLVLVLAIGMVLLLAFNWGTELWRDADKLSLLLGPSGNQTYFSY